MRPSRFAAVVCVLALSAGSMRAGSTTSLHTPQGGGAATENGDWISNSGEVDRYYSYFVEVPQGLASLQIQIFDPDIGLGGATEDTSGRDRDRAGYNTTATYSLRNPNGTVITPRFTTGNTTLPANSDNQWMTFYGVGNTVRDNFTTAAFSNNDGTADWAGNWIETDSAGLGVAAGSVQITGGQLRLTDNTSGNPALQRQVDLLGGDGVDLTTATLTYSFSTQGTEAGDTVLVQASNNGGGAWTTVNTHTGAVSGTASVNISAYIANNTRIQFIVNAGYGANEFFFADNVQISDGAAAPMAGHWEIRIDQTAGGDDINGIGIRAHDGDSGSGGTELLVYADSYLSLGVNPDGAGGATRTYTLYPWMTAGCTATQNDFDRDTNQGAVGSVTYTSRTGNFTQTITDAMLSNDDDWNRDNITGFVSNNFATDFGIWTVSSTITTYENETGNYETFYFGNYLAPNTDPPEGAQPLLNSGIPAAYRIYMPTDAGTAPVKPYLEQMLTSVAAQPAPAIGVARNYTVTVNIINPTAFPITFSNSNTITAVVPTGVGVVYAGDFSMDQGTLVSQPTVGTTGTVTWNPGVVAANDSATMAYDITVTPAAATTPATGSPNLTVANDTGTRAQYVDETGNTTQARATYRLGSLCQLNVVVGTLTEVALASFEVNERGRVSWTTASEAGTIGFNLYREDGSKVNDHLIPAGNRVYSIEDRSIAERYILEEVTAGGRTNRHGPLITGRRLGAEVERAKEGPLQRGFRANATVNTNAVASKGLGGLMTGVRETGIVRVPFADLAGYLGQSPASVAASAASGAISVKDNGQAVAWTATADAILFFGQKSESIYSNERIYKIEFTRGEQMTSVPVAGLAAAVSTFSGQANHETDSFPATVLPLNPEGDYWFWDYIVSGDPSVGRRTFSVNVPHVASASNATLEVRLQGALQGGAHRARVRLNNVPLGEVTWTDLASKTATLALPAGVLVNGTNVVEVEGVLDAPAPFDVFYIDGFTVRYSRLAQPVDGVVDAQITKKISAGPFGAQPTMLDVTNPLKPKLLTGGSFASSVQSATLPAGTSRVFFAQQFIAPSSYRSTYPAFLRTQRANYIVIAPAEMRSAAEELAAFRQREDGFRTLVVDLEQIYDEFSNGNPTPHAIRAYLTAMFSTPGKPKYIVLAGTGTVDYRGIEQAPGPIPPLMIQTPDGLFASDAKIADTNNDGKPDFAIGRIPVADNEQLFAYVEKLEQHSASLDENPIVFSADQIDQGTDFAAASDDSARALEGRPLARLHIDDLGPQTTRDELLEVWESGTPLVSWIGHGGLDQLASSGILTAGDAPALTSTGRLPVVVAMTCTINRFEDGIVEPLGAALTREPEAGALAVWSATGLSNHENAREMQRTFMRLAAQKPQSRLGDLIMLTHAVHPSDTAGVYVLLGDPAIALELPKEITNGGTPVPTGE